MCVCLCMCFCVCVCVCACVHTNFVTLSMLAPIKVVLRKVAETGQSTPAINVLAFGPVVQIKKKTSE